MQQTKICYSLKPGSKHSNDDFNRLISGIFLLLTNKIVKDQANAFELYKYSYVDLSNNFKLTEHYAILMESDEDVVPWDISDLYEGFEELIKFFDVVIGGGNNCDCLFQALSTFVIHKIQDVTSFSRYCANIKDVSLKLNVVCGFFPCLNFSEFPQGNAKTMAIRKGTIQAALIFIKPFLEFGLFHRILFCEFQWFKSNPSLINFLLSQSSVRQGIFGVMNDPMLLPNLLKYDSALLYHLMTHPDFIEKVFPKKPQGAALFIRWANSEVGREILDKMFLKLDFAKRILSNPHFLKQLCFLGTETKTSALFGLSKQPRLSILNKIIDRFSKIKLSEEDEVVICTSVVIPNQPLNPAEPINTVEGELENRQTEEERQIVKRFFEIFLPQGWFKMVDESQGDNALVHGAISEKGLSLLKNLYQQSKDMQYTQSVFSKSNKTAKSFCGEYEKGWKSAGISRSACRIF